MSLPLILILSAFAFFAMSGTASAQSVIAEIPDSVRKAAANAIRAASGGFSFFSWLDQSGAKQSGDGEDFAKAIEAGNAFTPQPLDATQLKAQADMIRARSGTQYKVAYRDGSIHTVNETQLATLLQQGLSGPISTQIPCFWEVKKTV